MTEHLRPADTWLSIKDACLRFGLSRRSFYRMLEDYPELERDGVVMRVPPVSGRRKVAARAFEGWVRVRNGVNGTGKA